MSIYWLVMHFVIIFKFIILCLYFQSEYLTTLSLFNTFKHWSFQCFFTPENSWTKNLLMARLIVSKSGYLSHLLAIKLVASQNLFSTFWPSIFNCWCHANLPFIFLHTNKKRFYLYLSDFVNHLQCVFHAPLKIVVKSYYVNY